MAMGGQRDPNLGTYSYNPYAAGRKQYGGGTTFSPTMGQVDPAGYQDREMRNQAKRNAYLQWMKARGTGAYADPNAQRLTGLY